MSDRKVLVILFGWFGNEDFRVRNMCDAKIDELAEILGIQAATHDAVRSKIGDWLKGKNGHEFVGGANEKLKLVMKVAPNDTRPGVHQFQQV